MRSLAALVAAVALCGGCGLFPRAEVALVGDSLLHDARDEVEDANLHHLSIRAMPGITIAQATHLVEEAAASRPDVLVIELGTNDGVLSTEELSLTASLAVLDTATSVPCVVWVAPAERNDITRRLVAHLDQQARERPNLRILRWDEAAAHPEWFAEDGVHHTDAGQVAFADAISEGIEDCLG